MSAPQSILFACNMNSVRSPMAEALARARFGEDIRIESCGVHEGYHDPFVAELLTSEGLEKPTRPPQTFNNVDVSAYDLIVTLTPEAAAAARRLGAKVVFWDVPNPTDERGDDETMRAAYRTCYDAISAHVQAL